MACLLILTAFLISSVTSEGGSPKPFQFRCYENDICTWPAQYCSSFVHERRCLPCLASVCDLEKTPHQCQYNCSLRGQKRSSADISDITQEKGRCSYIPTIIASTLGLVLFVIVSCLVVLVCRLKQQVKNKEDKIEEMVCLIKRSEQQEKDEKTETRPICVTGPYAEKLNHVSPTTDSSSPGPYQPTTHLDQRMSSKD